jgi:hypothetical protein
MWWDDVFLLGVMSNFFHQTLTYFVQGWYYLTIHTMNIHINHLYHINSHIPLLIFTKQRLYNHILSIDPSCNGYKACNNNVVHYNNDEYDEYHLYHINSHIPSLICTQQRLTMSNYDAYSSFDITGQELERRITDCSLVGYMKRLIIGVG